MSNYIDTNRSHYPAYMSEADKLALRKRYGNTVADAYQVQVNEMGLSDEQSAAALQLFSSVIEFSDRGAVAVMRAAIANISPTPETEPYWTADLQAFWLAELDSFLTFYATL